VLVAPDDTILFAGPSHSGSLLVQHRDRDGVIDGSFGEQGSATVAVEGHAIRPTGLTRQADGKIVVSGILDPDDDCFGCDTTAALIRLVGPPPE
jgi:hypothetical protein